jgi:hypothetical protein
MERQLPIPGDRFPNLAQRLASFTLNLPDFLGSSGRLLLHQTPGQFAL